MPQTTQQNHQIPLVIASIHKFPIFFLFLLLLILDGLHDATRYIWVWDLTQGVHVLVKWVSNGILKNVEFFSLQSNLAIPKFKEIHSALGRN